MNFMIIQLHAENGSYEFYYHKLRCVWFSSQVLHLDP